MTGRHYPNFSKDFAGGGAYEVISCHDRSHVEARIISHVVRVDQYTISSN